MKHLFKSSPLFFVLALAFPVYSAACSLRAWEEPFYMDWGIPAVLSGLLLIPCVLSLRKRQRILCPAPVLWCLLALAVGSGCAGNIFLYAAPWQIGISVALTMGVMCLLWAFLRGWSLLLWAPFLFLQMVQLESYRQYGTRFNSLVLAEIFEASGEETSAYLSDGNVLVLVRIIVLTLFFCAALYAVLRRQKFLRLANSGLVFSLCSVLLGCAIRPAHRTSQYYWPLDEACELWQACTEALLNNQETIKQVESLPSPAKAPSSLSTLKGGEGVVLVVHVGESVRADRMGINGYTRNTTPWLSSLGQKELINFPDCISAACDTCQAQIAILTDARRDVHEKDPGLVPHTGSVLDLFQANGFRVYSFFGRRCGQKLKYDRVIRVLTRCSAKRFNAPGSPWTAVPQMQDVLQSNKAGQNLVLFINNEGSHTPFSHYDTVNPPFQPAGDGFESPAEHAEEVNNAYDSTVHYTDEFVRRVVRQLQGRPFVYLYISDHGEYLGHDGIWGRGGLGESKLHYHDTEGCRVGMFMLASPEFRALHPHFSEALEQVQSHSGMTVGQEHVFHTLLGLFGISTPYYNAALDLASPQAQPYSGPRPQCK